MLKNVNLIILTGVSGSGKSTALRALEDLGYFCVDNLPAALLIPFAEEIVRKKEASSRAEIVNLSSSLRFALLVDCRDEAHYSVIQEASALLEKASLVLSLLFIDCNDDVAVRRFRETRRKHPLLGSSMPESKISNAQSAKFAETSKVPRNILEALAKERELLTEFRQAANRVIDTSNMNVHELKKLIEDLCEARRSLLVTLQSFGFKYGSPIDVDLMFDVRFLPNPFFDNELRTQTGLSLDVRDFVGRNPDTLSFLDRVDSLFDFLLPRYELEGKHYLSIGIGCTGGKHRSVVIAEDLGSRIKNKGRAVQMFHRDIDR
ncbi:MAG TPA: RNase adapter RapZ [Oligoflexia bacterium]|nr:RNase adapter RapZ [Oligoflexia bacterium]HMP49080.1 RNase adapter RapZ [Oligoflexia bacterium]